MDTTRHRRRRRFLTSLSGVVSLSVGAGCADREGAEPTESNEFETTESTTGRATDTEASSGDDTNGLDLREANVVDVSFEQENETYAFDVTLHHDDDGEEGYANWWQVERLDGTRLGRRELQHAHSQQPFTRSGTVEIQGDVNCVVIRGHDRTHGYGGVAAVVALGTGAVQPIDQGSEKRLFDAGDCP